MIKLILRNELLYKTTINNTDVYFSANKTKTGGVYTNIEFLHNKKFYVARRYHYKYIKKIQDIVHEELTKKDLLFIFDGFKHLDINIMYDLVESIKAGEVAWCLALFI